MAIVLNSASQGKVIGGGGPALLPEELKKCSHGKCHYTKWDEKNIACITETVPARSDLNQGH